jgi:hypothetical protein
VRRDPCRTKRIAAHAFEKRACYQSSAPITVRSKIVSGFERSGRSCNRCIYIEREQSTECSWLQRSLPVGQNLPHSAICVGPSEKSRKYGMRFPDEGSGVKSKPNTQARSGPCSL